MPSPLSSPDILAKAVLEKAPTAAVLTPNEQALKDIHAERAKSKPPVVLEFLRNRQPIEQRAVTEANDRNIGIDTERNRDGSRKRDAGEKRRFEEAKNYSQRSKDFLEKGYDGLTDPAQKKEIRDSVEQAIRAWPDGDLLLSTMLPTDIQLLVESKLKDPEFVARLRANFEAGRAMVVPDLPADIKSGFEEAKKEEDAKKKEVSRNDTDKKSVDAKIDEFEDRTTKGGKLGSKYAELRDLERTLPQELQKKRQLGDQLYLARAKLSSDQQKLSAYLLRGDEAVVEQLSQSMSLINNQVRTLEDQVAEIDEKENRKVALESERETLKQKGEELGTDRTRLDGELDTLTKARILAQTEFDSARLTRASQEQDYVDGLRNGFSESTFKYLEENITAADAVRRKLIEEEIARTPDPAKKAILEGTLNRWDKTKTVGILGKRTIKVIDGAQTKLDWDKCMMDMAEGPKGIMKKMLTDGGLSDADADTKLADPAFVAEMQPKVIERLTTRRIQTGKLTMDDARRIIENPAWGKSIIENAITNRQDIRGALADLEGKGILRGGIAEYLRNKSEGSKWKFLLILLGITALGVGPMAAGLKNALSEK